jgi:hypothetical protein
MPLLAGLLLLAELLLKLTSLLAKLQVRMQLLPLLTAVDAGNAAVSVAGVTNVFAWLLLAELLLLLLAKLQLTGLLMLQLEWQLLLA